MSPGPLYKSTREFLLLAFSLLFVVELFTATLSTSGDPGGLDASLTVPSVNVNYIKLFFFQLFKLIISNKYIKIFIRLDIVEQL